MSLSNRRVPPLRGDGTRHIYCPTIQIGQMIRFLFRFLATIALSVAVIMAVLDVTRTIASSALVLTPLATSWNTVSPATLEAVRAFIIERAHPLLWDPVIVFILRQPGFAVFLVLAFLLYAIGHKRQRPLDRFAVET